MTRMMIFAALAAMAPIAVQAATLTALPDLTDQEFAADLEPNEVAVGEIRIGAPGAERELGINTPPPATPVAEGQFDFVDGQAYAFDFGYDAATMELSLTLDTVTISTTQFSNIGDADSLYIRTFASDRDGVNQTVINNIAFNGDDFGGASQTSTDGERLYSVITDVDFGEDWNLTGDISFVNPGALRSNYAVQFKLVDEVPDIAPIPLPAAGWMLLAGLGGLAALRRRMV